MQDSDPNSTNNATTNAHEFTVSQLSQAVKNTVEEEFGFVRVRGEVGRMSRPGSGHVYFDLKDDKSVLAAVAWKGVVSRWRFQPEQGLEVIATGRLTTFPGQSKYQIIVENVEPAGAGALMALLEERRKKLTAEGLFDENKKQSLPYLPKVIGVVTSPSGAVIRDILHRLADRFPTHVVVWPVRVQGASCAPEVANAIEGLNMLPPGGDIARPDLIIVARGGGSVEDLWGFNEEEVVRAISESTIPVISAIGHETDTSLADFAADRRAPTPTGAAEMAVPVRAELIAYVKDLSTRQFGASQRLLTSRRDRLRAARAGLPKPDEIVAIARQRLDLAQTRLGAALANATRAKALQLARTAPRLSKQALQRMVDAHAKTVAGFSNRLLPATSRILLLKRQTMEQRWQLANSLGYKNVLQRGYALVTDKNGKIVRQASALSANKQVSLGFVDGWRDATIIGGQGAPEKRKRKKSKAAT
ncbi:MAG: exodeoxyribonuclease VII large subunit, partial [Devosiaceae bacterium]|nr:exodeoxyribonuclease VII large subunit [Devosiaceae bacterium]